MLASAQDDTQMPCFHNMVYCCRGVNKEENIKVEEAAENPEVMSLKKMINSPGSYQQTG